MLFQCIYLHLFQWSLSSSQAVFILLPPFPQQPPAGAGGISHRLSPAWTWSKRAQYSSICAALSLPDGIKNKACCSKLGTRSIWPISQEPLSCLAAGFSPSPAVGAGSSCWQPAHLISGTFSSLWCWPSCPTHHILCIHIYIMLLLSGSKISMVGLFL